MATESHAEQVVASVCLNEESPDEFCDFWPDKFEEFYVSALDHQLVTCKLQKLLLNAAALLFPQACLAERVDFRKITHNPCVYVVGWLEKDTRAPRHEMFEVFGSTGKLSTPK